MKRLNGREAKLIKDIIQDNDALIEIDNKRYYLSLVEEPRTQYPKADGKDIARIKYRQKKLDILRGKHFSIDDVVEMMERGVM